MMTVPFHFSPARPSNTSRIRRNWNLFVWNKRNALTLPLHCDAAARCRSYGRSQMETPLDAIKLRRLWLLSVYYCLFTRRNNALLIMNYAPNFVAGNFGVRAECVVCGIDSHVDQRARWLKSKQMSELLTERIRFAAARCFSVFMARSIPFTGKASRTEADLIDRNASRGLK